jgi:tetratricopeptide (TPR) repeat protein
LHRISIAFLGLLGTVGDAHGQRLVVLDRKLNEVEAWAREDTNDADRQYFLALRHWKEHHWRQTDSLLRLTIQLEPRYAEAYLALYYLPFVRRVSLRDEEMNGRVPDSWKAPLEEANRFYQRAFRTNPMVTLNVMTVVYGIEERRAIDFAPSEYLEYQRCCAWAVDFGLGRYRSAYERLKTLAQREYDEAQHPDRVPDALLLYRGLAGAHTMNIDAAIADFRVLLDRSLKKLQRNEMVHVPLGDNEYRFMLAALHHVSGHADSAIVLYQEALEHDLGLVMAHTYLASIYDKAGRAEDAMTERRRAAEVSSDDPTALYDLGVSLFKWGMTTQADEPLQQAISLNARYAPPYFLLARVDEDLGRVAAAREHYTRFLATAPLRMEDWRASAQQRLDSLPK